MAQSSTDELRSALNSDLKKVKFEGLESVVDDTTRRLFTARISGATLEFAHKQPDQDFWNGMKFYGSGPSSRIRFRRTPVVAKVKATRTRKVKVKLPAAEAPAELAAL